jgi:hypothetical protein
MTKRSARAPALENRRSGTRTSVAQRPGPSSYDTVTPLSGRNSHQTELAQARMLPAIPDHNVIEKLDAEDVTRFDESACELDVRA